MQFFLVGSARGDEGGIAALATELSGAPPSRLPDLDGLRTDARFKAATRSLVLLPVGPNAVDSIDAAIAFAAEYGDHAFVVCFADTIAPEQYKRLLRTGHAEWISWPTLDTDFRELASRLQAAPTRASREAASIVSFLPSKGGVGNSTLVVEIGYGLSVGKMWPRRARKSGAKQRVAILDLNWQGGTVADALDIQPRFDMAEVIRRPDRLDEHLIDIFASRHEPSGLDVFACPPSRLGVDSVTPDIVFTVIDAIASRYELLLIDLPVGWLTWTDHLLHGSDGIVVTGGETVPALRQLKAALHGVDACGLAADKVVVAVNEVATDLLGRPSGRTIIEKAMSGRRKFLLRRDDDGVRAALDAGRPITELAASGRFSRDLKPLAAWVAEIAGHAETSDKPARKAA